MQLLQISDVVYLFDGSALAHVVVHLVLRSQKTNIAAKILTEGCTSSALWSLPLRRKVRSRLLFQSGLHPIIFISN